MKSTDRRRFNSEGELQTSSSEDEMAREGEATVRALPEHDGYYQVTFAGRNCTVHAESAEHALTLVRSCIPAPGDPAVAAEIERQAHCHCNAACHPAGDCPAPAEVLMLNRDKIATDCSKNVCAACQPSLKAIGWETSSAWAAREAERDLAVFHPDDPFWGSRIF